MHNGINVFYLYVNGNHRWIYCVIHIKSLLYRNTWGDVSRAFPQVPLPDALSQPVKKWQQCHGSLDSSATADYASALEGWYRWALPEDPPFAHLAYLNMAATIKQSNIFWTSIHKGRDLGKKKRNTILKNHTKATFMPSSRSCQLLLIWNCCKMQFKKKKKRCMNKDGKIIVF